MDTRVKPAYDDCRAQLAPRPLPLHRLPADIAAAKAFRPIDLVDRLIGALLCLEDGLAGCANVQHAAAIGENLSVLRHRAGVENLDAFDLGGLAESINYRALAVVAGIALGRHDHGERDVVLPAP